MSESVAPLTESEADAIWKQTATEREIALARARATYNDACAEAERDFASDLAHRIVDRLVAERDARSASKPA